MNKGRRQELKRLKFIKRLKKYGLLDKLNDPKANLHSFKSHGAPCSCSLCRDEKYRDKRGKWKKN